MSRAPASAIRRAEGADQARRARLLESVRAGAVPAGGPRLSRREVDLLCGPAGDAREAILEARAAEWELLECARKDRPGLEPRLRAIEQRLSLLGPSLRAARDLDGARAVLDAQTALRRALVGQREARVPGGGAPDASHAAAAPAQARAESGETVAPARRRRSARDWIRIGVLLSLLGAASVIAVKTRPEDLPRLRPPPRAEAVSSELKLREIHVVGDIVFARSEAWATLERERRDAEAEAACARVRAIGFAGLVLKDDERKTVASCVGQGSAPQNEG